MRCSNCKTENLEGSLLCSKCGRALQSGPNQPMASQAQSITTPAVSGPVAPTPVAPIAPPTPAPAVAAAAFAGDRPYVEGVTYKASGLYDSGLLPLMVGASLLGGLLVGTIYHFIAQFFDLVLIFPIIAGACAGGLIGFIVKNNKVRSPKIAGVCGLLGALCLSMTMQVEGAYALRGYMVEAFTQDDVAAASVDAGGNPITLPPATLAKVEQKMRGEEEAYLNPWRTVEFYEINRGIVGTSLKHNGAGSGIELKGSWFWALELAELVVMIIAAYSVASGAASKPFCENCMLWHVDKAILKVHPIQNPLLWKAIDTKDWKALMSIPVGKKMDNKNQTTVAVTRCERCDCGTIHATSAGGRVPAEIQYRQLAPETTRDLLSTSATTAPTTA